MNALVRQNHEVIYLSLDAPPANSLTGISWKRIPFWTSSRKGFIFWGTFTIWLPIYLLQFTRKNKLDRLLAFGGYYAWVLSFVKKKTAVPLVLFMRSLVFEIDRINRKFGLISFLSRIIERKGLLSASRVIFMTNTMKERAQKFVHKDFEDSVILPNEVPEVKVHRSWDGKILKILAAGVIDERKNLDFLITALLRLPPNVRSKCQITIAGDGPKRAALERHSTLVGLNNVEFIGWSSEMSRLYEEADLFIHPSFHEGVSNAVVEALSAGLPVLASDIPEHREIFNGTETLFALSTTNNLATILEVIIKDPPRLNQIQVASLRAANALHFDWDSLATKVIN